jgi:uncharacterized protein YecE (DUF72 family)
VARGRIPDGGQLDLFGTDPAPAAGGAPDAPAAGRAPAEGIPASPGRRGQGSVGPADVPEAAELAHLLPDGLRLGTSSWSFPGWAGLVYDRAATEPELARDGLAAYARHPLLRAVGLDRTFYAPISAGEYARYAAQVPEGFRFLVKAVQGCTFPSVRAPGPGGGSAWKPNPRFLDPAFAADAVVRPAVEGLGPRLGVVLFQFPPLPRPQVRDPAALAARVEAFLRALPPGPLYGVEIRNRELVVPAWGEALGEAGAAHAFVVHPAMPTVLEQAEVLPVERQPSLVVRWMLGHGRGYEEAKDLYAPFDALAAPDPDARAQIAWLCRRAAGLGRGGIVVVNNKAEGPPRLWVVVGGRAPAPPPGGRQPL